MIAEIVKFTEQAPARLMNINAKPRPGLHILFRLSLEQQQWVLDKASIPTALFSKEEQGVIQEVGGEDEMAYYDGKSELTPFLKGCSLKEASAWCINTNKCFDLPAKGIHSCSPYCVAFKRDSLRGGSKYDKDSQKLEERFADYFTKALDLVTTEERLKLEVFANFFKDVNAFYSYLERIPKLKELNDKEYIIFYLDEPIESYHSANKQYLKDKLFNTNDYNTELENGEIMGTSDFLNGFNSKKPFLQHQSATFQIPGRISAFEARKLYEFLGLIRQGFFPRPLPIFVNQAEAEALQQHYYRFLELEIDQAKTPTHRAVIENLLKETEEDLGNFYLMYYSVGKDIEVKDFDFVSKFRYELKDADGSPWRIIDFFNIKYAPALSNVFDFQENVLPVVFDNALVVKKEGQPIKLKYFDKIEEKYCKSSGVYLLVMRFRAAFYDFIYKSRHQAVTSSMFHEIMAKGIMENIGLDVVRSGKNSEEYRIKQKLNVWLSLYHHFEQNHQKSENMENHITSLRAFMADLAAGKRDIATDEEGAFAVGQVIGYLFRKVSTSKQQHSRLEPFLRKKSDERVKEDLVKLFNSYKHVNHTTRFDKAFSQVLACHWEKPIASYLPILLSGYFSDNELLKTKKPSGGDPQEEE